LKHIPELDSIRGLAAISVLWLHIDMTTSGASWTAAKPEWFILLEKASGIGSYGVDVFFVLSGFLITSLLLERRRQPDYFRDFYWKRILRIQPVYFMHLVAAWFVFPKDHWYVLLALLFLVNFSNAFHLPAQVGPAWTLSIEEQFYLVWPTVVRRLDRHRVEQLAYLCIVGSVLLRGVMMGALHRADLEYTFYRMDGLGFGALLACQMDRTDWGRKPGNHWYNNQAVLIVALIFEVAGFWVWGSIFWIKCLFLLSTNYLAYRLIRFCAMNTGSPLTAILRWRSLIFVGSISYGLYMFHVFVLFGMDRWVLTQTGFTPSMFFVRALLIAAASIAVSALSLHLIELPIRTLGRRSLKHRIPVQGESLIP